MYETLYVSAGYHSGTRDAHGGPLAKLIKRSFREEVQSVLDVGCSHGALVSQLWQDGVTASGTDVSPTAVRRAYEERCKPEGKCTAQLIGRAPPAGVLNGRSSFSGRPRCVGDCFRVGSAIGLPWPDNSFDAVVSSDMLEHIAEEDVPAAVREFHRVSRKYVLLLIASRTEFNKVPTNRLKALARKAISDGDTSSHSQQLAAVDTLHLTVRNVSWWSRAFVEHARFELLVERSVGWATHDIQLRKLDLAAGSFVAPPERVGLRSA